VAAAPEKGDKIAPLQDRLSKDQAEETSMI
jgi:hypothetical protein